MGSVRLCGESIFVARWRCAERWQAVRFRPPQPATPRRHAPALAGTAPGEATGKEPAGWARAREANQMEKEWRGGGCLACPAAFPLFWMMFTPSAPVAAFTARARRGSSLRTFAACGWVDGCEWVGEWVWMGGRGQVGGCVGRGRGAHDVLRHIHDGGVAFSLRARTDTGERTQGVSDAKPSQIPQRAAAAAGEMVRSDGQDKQREGRRGVRRLWDEEGVAAGHGKRVEECEGVLRLEDLGGRWVRGHGRQRTEGTVQMIGGGMLTRGSTAILSPGDTRGEGRCTARIECYTREMGTGRAGGTETPNTVDWLRPQIPAPCSTGSSPRRS